MRNDLKYIFGPVVSRRLGISLGVDLMPYKTCTLDCVYCECGGTTDLVSDIAEYVPVEEVISELGAYLALSPKLDYVTFSGAGEPTLHSGLGRIIDYLKRNFGEYKVAVITNGTLFHLSSVREALAEADLVMASIDALDEGIFFSINRPHQDLTLFEMKNGLLEFKKCFKGKLWVEIFIVPDINDGEDHLDKLRDFIALLKPDKIQINSLDRPGTESWVGQVGPERLSFISSYLDNSEIISSHEKEKTLLPVFQEELRQRILNSISRRPCTLADISVVTGEESEKIGEILKEFVSEGIVRSENMARGVFFSLVQ